MHVEETHTHWSSHLSEPVHDCRVIERERNGASLRRSDAHRWALRHAQHGGMTSQYWHSTSIVLVSERGSATVRGGVCLRGGGLRSGGGGWRASAHSRLNMERKRKGIREGNSEK